MYLTNPSGGWTSHKFECRLAHHLDDPETAVIGALPHESAWRVLLVGTEPGRLIESNVITSLNPDSAIQDTSWIRPGKASWDWWSGSLGPDGKPAYTTKNMKVWIWLGYRETAKQMEAAFPLYEKWGVAGLKIDFIERDDQDGIDWYYRVADLAARHHLMVDFHGATKPTGMERTYP